VQQIISGILKVAPGCTFKINTEGCEICSRSVDIRAKAFFQTNTILSEGPIEFTFASLSKFTMALRALEDCGELENIELECNGSTLTYKGKSKFRLILDDPLCIEIYTYNRSGTEHNDIFKFPITGLQISTIRKYTSLNIQESKAYFYVKDNIVYVDVDDKQKKKVSSVTLPITDKFKGKDNEPFCVNINDMTLYTCLNPDKITLSLLDNYLLRVESVLSNKELNLLSRMTLYCETLNG